MPVPGHGASRVLYRLVSLEQAATERERLVSSLAGEELLRGNRLIDRGKAELFLLGRGVLRQTLSGVVGMEPGEIRFSEGEFGKPYLSEQAEGDPIGFNVSHAGSYLLVAVGHGAEVGVDLEEVRQDLDYAPMARRYFSRREQEDLFALEPQERIAAFYRCWTRKEAYLKGTGSGFSRPSTSFDVSFLPHQAPALLAHRGSAAEVDRWTIRDLPAPEGYLAAIAIEDKNARTARTTPSS